MIPRISQAAAGLALVALAGGVSAQQHDPATPLAVASKVALRGEANSIAVREMRIVRKNDILVAQADMANMGRSDRTVFYRFKWLDNVGNQVGDGESWKQPRPVRYPQFPPYAFLPPLAWAFQTVSQRRRLESP